MCTLKPTFALRLSPKTRFTILQEHHGNEEISRNMQLKLHNKSSPDSYSRSKWNMTPGLTTPLDKNKHTCILQPFVFNILNVYYNLVPVASCDLSLLLPSVQRSAKRRVCLLTYNQAEQDWQSLDTANLPVQQIMFSLGKSHHPSYSTSYPFRNLSWEKG